MYMYNTLVILKRHRQINKRSILKLLFLGIRTSKGKKQNSYRITLLSLRPSLKTRTCKFQTEIITKYLALWFLGVNAIKRYERLCTNFAVFCMKSAAESKPKREGNTSREPTVIKFFTK